MKWVAQEHRSIPHHSLMGIIYWLLPDMLTTCPYSTLANDGDGRWCYSMVGKAIKKHETKYRFCHFVGVKAECVFVLQEAYSKPPIIRQELICIYSNLMHNVVHQLPLGV